MQKITTITQEELSTKCFTDKHEVIADEPIELEGKDLGMMPSELLLSSVASCTAITLKMYTKRKQWELKSVKIDMTLDKEENKMIKQIKVQGNFDDKQLQRLLTISKKCPVHKIVEKGIEINSSISLEK